MTINKWLKDKKKVRFKPDEDDDDDDDDTSQF
jgi:endogenous inhibitor of DNA gyrase (YacG/DUF329 family)